MTWTPQVEQWRQAALWDARDVPPGIVLCIIDGESAGIPGAMGPSPLIGAELKKDDGSTISVFQALGLMQCAPLVIQAYNQAHTPPVTFEDMTGKDERAARQQIRVGAFAFASAVNRLNKYDPAAFPAKSPGSAGTNQLQIALASYAAGFGPIKEALDALKASRRPVTFINLVNSSSHGGVDYARRRWAVYVKHEPDEAKQSDRKDKDKKTDNSSGGIVALIAAFLLYKIIKRKTQGHAGPTAPLLSI